MIYWERKLPISSYDSCFLACFHDCIICWFLDYVSNTDIKKIYFIIYEKTNEHNKAEARVLFFLCIWAVVGLFFTVTIHVDRA